MLPKKWGLNALSIFHRCGPKSALPRCRSYANRTWLSQPTNMVAQNLPPNRRYARRMCLLRFSPVVIYGPNPKGNMRTLVRLARSSLPLPAASFTSRRSLLGVENLISAIIFALNNPATIGETYLVADSKAMTIGEILTMLRKIQGRSSSTISIPQVIVRLLLMLCGRTDLWSRLSGNFVVDTSKLESVGWRPAIDTYEGLLEMMRAEDGEP